MIGCLRTRELGQGPLRRPGVNVLTVGPPRVVIRCGTITLASSNQCRAVDRWWGCGRRRLASKAPSESFAAISGRNAPISPASSAPAPRRGPERRLSVRTVIGAATALADDAGLVAVRTRRVAQQLEVSAMTPHAYVPGKAELFDLMLDATCQRLPLANTTGQPWRQRLTVIGATVTQVNRWSLDGLVRISAGRRLSSCTDAMVRISPAQGAGGRAPRRDLGRSARPAGPGR